MKKCDLSVNVRRRALCANRLARVELLRDAADVLAIPSDYERLSSVLIEAMALGAPDRRIGCAGERRSTWRRSLRAGDPPRDDDRALAPAFFKLLEDAALQTTLSEAARQSFQEFYELNLADATFEMYRRVINE